MLFNIVLASAAVVGLAGAQSVGSATLVNGCGYTVYLANTPSADGVHQTQSAVLAPGQSYSQVYTELANLNGWSIKVAQQDSFPDDATFQFEYTFLNDGIIWFDMSNVNNQEWNVPLHISSSDDSCNSTMRQVAYKFPTDNAAMQTSCQQSADVTVVVCRNADDDGSSTTAPSSYVAPTSQAAPSSSAAAPTSQAPAPVSTTSSPPAPVVPPTPTQFAHSSASDEPFIPGFSAGPGSHGHNGFLVADNNDADNSVVSTPTVSPTTFTTSTLAAVLETNGAVETLWVTEIVTEHLTLTTTATPKATDFAKRHAHAHAHVHGHAH